ncbi:MAG: hypothetical protein M3T56_04830 [Chloroflexota bacterium]|nr:hypothetical protein [Chloroflexota bacterium]
MSDPAVRGRRAGGARYGGTCGAGGLVTALVAVGARATFEDAYAALGTGALTTFVASFDGTKEDGAEIAVTQTANATGDHGWTRYAFPPNSVVLVRITGVANGYDLVFTVTADDRGIFRDPSGRPRRPGPTRSRRRAAPCTRAPRS